MDQVKHPDGAARERHQLILVRSLHPPQTAKAWHVKHCVQSNPRHFHQDSRPKLAWQLHPLYLTTICQTFGDDIVQDGNDVTLVVGDCAPQALNLMWEDSTMLRSHVVHAF